MRKLMLFFAALMMTLGVKAQTQTHELQTPNADGYFNFATEFLGMEECTETTVFENGMLIAIQHAHDVSGHAHEGHFLEIYSKEEGGVHKMRMFDKCHGLSAFILVKVDGGFKLQTVLKDHFVGELHAQYSKTTTSRSYPGVYNFTWRTGSATDSKTGITTDFSGFSVDCSNDKSLYVNANDGTVELCGAKYSDVNAEGHKKYQIFKIYKLSQPYGITGYVENAKVSIVGPAGNIIETVHTGWSDFYEFTANGDSHYGCSLLNTMYYPETNEIIAGVKYPFAISGKVAKVPVHLCPSGDERYRIAIENGNLEMVDTLNSDGWKKNKNNQWYIFPKYDNMTLTYAIQNVATGQYIKFTAGSRDITLSESPSYFDLGGTSQGLNFWFAYSNYYNYCLYASPNQYTNKWGTYTIDAFKVHTLDKTDTSNSGINFLVPSVSGDELDGVDAIGFVRRYHEDTYFWDAGSVNLVNAPRAMASLFQSSDHENFGEGTHLLYSAQTGIDVPKTGAVTVEFEYVDGLNGLLILGVDIINQVGEVVAFDYHIGLAAKGSYAKSNVYTLDNVPMAMGSYHLRYWVCNRTDTDASVGHNLKNTQGAIHVTGADYRVVFSQPLVDGKFAANTTWFRMRLSDGLEKYISAQPAYMDAKNNLMLANNTPPNDYAGLWAVIGDKENGYKFYNRAWGPEYAMKTVGENGAARTYMVPVAEASTYDIVQRDRSTNDYKFYVKLHGTDNNYLNDHANSRYLATWTDGGLGDPGSVMTFETLNMEVFEANTETVKNTLAEKWMPWAAEPEVAPIIGDFAQLMLNRNSFALLDGKVFKFANQGNNNRTGKLLGVNASNQGAGLTATGNSEDYMQFIDNGDGTFKLFHIATARYLGLPGEAATTTKSSEAAAYTYTFQDATQKEQLTFQTSDQTLHLQNSFVLMNYGNNDAASRWIVSYDENAQELGAVAIEAQEMLEEITSEAYLANAGQQGYASPAQIEAYQNAIQGLSGKSVAEAMSALETSMNAIEDAEKNIRYLNSLEQLSNTGIYGIHCALGPLAYVAGNSTTQLSTPKYDSDADISANVVANENEQFAILRTENTPAGWYYLYNITTKKFVSKDLTLTENPVCAVNFRDISGYDADYRWEVWFGETINDEKVDDKLNVNQREGLALNKYYEMDEGNKFRIEYAETNEAKTAPAIEAIIALEKAKAEATALLNSVQGKVGYPNADACTTLQNAITAATNVDAVAAALNDFKVSGNINLPEDGKAYKISAWWRGRTLPLTFVAETSVSGLYAPAYVPTENAVDGNVSVFVCRKLEDGTYAFVTDNGYYFGWQTDDDSSNGTSTTYSDATHWKVEKAVTGNNTGDLKQAELLGKLLLRANGTAAGVKGWFAYMYSYSSSSKHFHNAGANDLYYGDDAHTVYYTFEEVSAYTLNTIKMNKLEGENSLLTGLEEGMSMSTFSAPYPTVTPEGITAYYAKDISTTTEDGESKDVAVLQKMRTAIPAGQGVVLVGEVGKSGTFKMLPAAEEEVPAELNNRLSATGAQSVEMGKSGVDYILGKGSKGVGFYKAKAGSTLAAGKAYFHFGTQGARNFVLRFGGETTDIEDAVLAPAMDNDAIYDLSGRRVNEVTKGGIYIKNGKKFIVK